MLEHDHEDHKGCKYVCKIAMDRLHKISFRTFKKSRNLGVGDCRLGSYNRWKEVKVGGDGDGDLLVTILKLCKMDL